VNFNIHISFEKPGLKMKIGFAALMLLFSFSLSPAHAQKKVRNFFKSADKFFSFYIDGNRVDYLSIKKDPGQVKILVQEIAGLDLSRISKKKAKAIYINAYNIFLIQNIVTNYPAYSPLEETGLFSEKRNAIDGEWRTLNELEKVMFGKFKDFKLYAVLSSGTDGCPSVMNFAYRPRGLNHKLKERLRIAVNNPDFIRVKNKSSLILFCEAFKNYKSFFEEKDLVRYANKFRSEKLPLNYKIGFYPGMRELNVKRN
jgi:hypothetical protein